jgi:hypothetical protein
LTEVYFYDTIVLFLSVTSGEEKGYQGEMHLVTEAFRRSGKVEVATVVLEDYVRGMSEYDFGRFIDAFLTPSEEELALSVLASIPLHRQFQGDEYRGRENTSDRYICRDIALRAEHKETLRALTSSYYWNFTLGEVRYHDRALATEMETMRATMSPFTLDWEGREGRPLRFRR